MTRTTDDQEFAVEASDEAIKSIAHEPSLPDELLADVIEDAILRIVESAELTEQEEE